MLRVIVDGTLKNRIAFVALKIKEIIFGITSIIFMPLTFRINKSPPLEGLF